LVEYRGGVAVIALGGAGTGGAGRGAAAHGRVEGTDQVLPAEPARVVADDLGEQGFLGQGASAGELGPDPAPVVDRLAGLIRLTATQKARDIFQSQNIFTAGGQRERAIDGQTEIGDVRERG